MQSSKLRSDRLFAAQTTILCTDFSKKEIFLRKKLILEIRIYIFVWVIWCCVNYYTKSEHHPIVTEPKT